MIEIVLEADPNCPLCEMAKRHLREIAKRHNVAFTVRYYATRSIASAWGTEPVTQHLYTPEAPERYGIKVSKEAKEVLGAMSQLGLNLYPIIRIRWGMFKNKEVVIRGWQADSEFPAKLESIISFLESIDR
jgi:thiol-disulfide isomerase/thioredoxin